MLFMFLREFRMPLQALHPNFRPFRSELEIKVGWNMKISGNFLSKENKGEKRKKNPEIFRIFTHFLATSTSGAHKVLIICLFVCPSEPSLSEQIWSLCFIQNPTINDPCHFTQIGTRKGKPRIRLGVGFNPKRYSE